MRFKETYFDGSALGVTGTNGQDLVSLLVPGYAVLTSSKKEQNSCPLLPSPWYLGYACVVAKGLSKPLWPSPFNGFFQPYPFLVFLNNVLIPCKLTQHVGPNNVTCDNDELTDELNSMIVISMSSSSSVDRAPARCLGGHGFESYQELHARSCHVD